MTWKHSSNKTISYKVSVPANWYVAQREDFDEQHTFMGNLLRQQADCHEKQLCEAHSDNF